MKCSLDGETMIKGIAHTGISTINYQAIIDFYADVNGFEVLSDGIFKGGLYDSLMNLNGVEGRAELLQLGSSQLEIFEFLNPKSKSSDQNRPLYKQGITHICFSVIDIESTYKRLKASGMQFHCTPQDFGEEGKATYGRDPDGNVIELFESSNLCPSII